MNLLHLLIRTFCLLLLAVFGTVAAFAAPGNWTRVSYPAVAQEQSAQPVKLTNTARALPATSANVMATGAAFAQTGGVHASNDREIRVAALAFDGGFIATNSAGEVFTGARTLSRLDAEGWDLAEEFYEQMRRTGGGVDEIAQNTGLSRGAVDRAYRHLFLDQHQLDDGLRRFDADPEIVNAWNRMRNGNHTSADIDLINHERFEAILMNRYGQPYRCAHATANACGFQSPID